MLDMQECCAATGSRLRPVPDLSKFTSLHQMWDVWHQGTRTQMSYKQLEEQQGNTWRKDPAGDKSKTNSERWCVDQCMPASANILCT